MKKSIIFIIAFMILLSGSMFGKDSKKQKIKTLDEYRKAVQSIPEVLDIDGTPLYISVWNDGQMGVYGYGVDQYYDFSDKGTLLFLDDTDYHYSMGEVDSDDGGGIEFTPVSNSQPDPWTIVTVYQAADANVEITQTTTYINGSNYYKIKWEITNNDGSETYTDCHLIHGGDTYFAGDDDSQGHYSNDLNMVFITNPDLTISGIMGLYGHESTPIDHYYEGEYSDNWEEMRSGHLPDEVLPDYEDAGYSVQWDRASLAPGETWTVIALERWTEPGEVQVYPPSPIDISPDDVVTLDFVIQNFQIEDFEGLAKSLEASVTYDLTVDSYNGWSVTVTPEQVTLGDFETEKVEVEVTVPSGVISTDIITVTATDSETDTITNSDNTQLLVNGEPLVILPPGSPIWSYYLEDYCTTSPAIADDGTIYIGDDSGYLRAINPDGSLKWEFSDTDDGFWWSSPAIANDGTIYIGNDDYYLYAINPNGTEKWNFETGDKIRSSPAIGFDGTIYIGSDDGYFYAIDPADGDSLWSIDLNHPVRGSAAIAPDGTIYIGAGHYMNGDGEEDGRFYALRQDGTIKWEYDTDDETFSSPAIGADGTIYIADRGGYLRALTPDGTLLWEESYSGDFIWSSPIIGPDGRIYIGDDDGYFYAIDPSDGSEIWSTYLESDIRSSAAIAANGLIYIGSDDYTFFAIEPDGDISWEKSFESEVRSSAAISPDGTVYICDGGYEEYGYLYAFEEDNGGPANSPWPMLYNNNKRTKVAPSGILMARQLPNFEVEVGEHFINTQIPLRNIFYIEENDPNEEQGEALGKNTKTTDNNYNIIKSIYSIDDSVTARYCCCCCIDTLIFGGINNDILYLNYFKHADGFGTVTLKGEWVGQIELVEFDIEVVSVIPGDTINYAGDTTAFEVALEEEILPTEYGLEQNYPNPFNPTTLIPFSLPESAPVTLTIYDINGKIVKTLIAGQLNAGYHKFEIDATKFSTGIYFYRLQAGSFTDIKKMTIIK